ncbi:MAG: ABC transporter permease [Eubacteriales bacterium]
MKSSIKKRLSGYAKTLIFPVLMWLLFAIAALIAGKEYFFSAYIISNIFRGSVLSFIVGLAIAIPLSGGRWDFAPGTIATLGGIIGINLGTGWGLNVFGVLFVCIVVCVILALIEAAAYLLLRVPNMIVSLGVVMVYEALTGIFFGGNGANIFNAPADYANNLLMLSRAPWCYILLAVVILVLNFLLYRTRFGSNLKSLGNNARLAINAGVNEKLNIVLTYVLVGVLLGIAALLNACNAQITAASNLSSTTLMFSSMGPVLIGLFLAGYSSMPWGIFMGSLGMSVMTYGLTSFGIDGAIVTIITGIIIVLIMAYTTNQAKIVAMIRKLLRRKEKESAC